MREVLTTYKRCKMLIEKDYYNKEDMLNNLDLFLLGYRITQEEYSELTSLMNSVETENSIT